MAQERTETKTLPTEADLHAVMAQVTALREDMAKLATTVSAVAGQSGHAFARDVSDGMAEAARYVGRKTHETDVRLESAVAANPYMALGMAALAGLVLGALTRR
ncbi:MAG TPA: hypothetical protein VLA78_07610 [Paracoccaceae bacterium]|jgi:ElaB/YqjD/DUF883 family membrane-anchored ribosome-binding protein|nr:hypothetical protein [Paracoccaceae bacterium]